MHIALTLVLLLAAAVPAVADSHPRLRGATLDETRLIEDLLCRSSIARALADEIAASDLIVYVELTAALRAGHGATRFVATAGGFRFLRVVLGAMTHPADRAALLAHELQHVVEIGRAADVRDTNGLRRLYAVIGEDRSAQQAFETAAARDVGARVRREISGPPLARTRGE